MDFFGIGPLELIVIAIIALIVLGPERLVEASRSLGKTMNAFRRAASDLTTQVNREIEQAKVTDLQTKLPPGSPPPHSDASQAQPPKSQPPGEG